MDKGFIEEGCWSLHDQDDTYMCQSAVADGYPSLNTSYWIADSCDVFLELLSDFYVQCDIGNQLDEP